MEKNIGTLKDEKAALETANQKQAAEAEKLNQTITDLEKAKKDAEDSVAALTQHVEELNALIEKMNDFLAENGLVFEDK